jgi:acetaldehyde dehydrogenase
MSNIQKIRVAILGTGNIGTDLLIKIMRSEYATCTLFAGRTLGSVGMLRAQSLAINVSDQGIGAIVADPSICDIVVDCTSAQAHVEHWKVCKELGKTIIDMTPAKLGYACVPAIATGDYLCEDAQNINMITCGGQTSIPIAYALGQVHKDIEYIEVASTIASLSAGPATRQNLDEYVETTTDALTKFSGAKSSKAILILNPADPPIYMQTTIYAKIKNPNLARITESVEHMIKTIQQYSPGYQLVVPPVVRGDTVVISVKVLGAGDHLPQYAGNLDIINCAALAVIELIAKTRLGK